MEVPEIGTEERLEKLKAVELAAAEERAAAARVVAAEARQLEEGDVYYGARDSLTLAQRVLLDAFPSSGAWISGGQPSKPKPPELTQREHEVWLSAYSAAHASPHAMGAGSTHQAKVAAASARLAVESYRELVNGTGADG